MAAPAKNKFWKLRSRHGREKIFKESKTMLLAAYDYFETNQKNTWYKKEVIKGGDLAGQIIDVPMETPLSLEGLTQFWGVNRKYLSDFEKSLPEGENDFSPVIAHIREVIERQQFEGAVVGAFNANIIARKLGLSEKTDITSNGKEMLTDKSDEDLKKLLQDTISKIDG